MTPEQLFTVLWSIVATLSLAAGFVVCMVASMLLSWIWLIKKLFNLGK